MLKALQYFIVMLFSHIYNSRLLRLGYFTYPYCDFVCIPFGRSAQWTSQHIKCSWMQTHFVNTASFFGALLAPGQQWNYVKPSQYVECHPCLQQTHAPIWKLANTKLILKLLLWSIANTYRYDLYKNTHATATTMKQSLVVHFGPVLHIGQYDSPYCHPQLINFFSNSRIIFC